MIVVLSYTHACHSVKIVYAFSSINLVNMMLPNKMIQWFDLTTIRLYKTQTSMG